jgi:DNA (cytosine-5)-methyltransferase 1
LSVAGKRAGLDGERSGLFFEAIRIIKEMRDATSNAFPRWAVWENVAGALSSNGGADFGVVLDTLADAGALVIEWAVLDARWFGVPQRRRRIFVVACFDPATSARCPDPLLPVAARSGWHPPTSDSARQKVTSIIGGGVDSRSREPDIDRMTFVPVDVVGGLQARSYKGPNHEAARDGHLLPVIAFDNAGPVELSPTLNTGAWQGPRRNQNAISVVTVYRGGNINGWHEGVGPLRAAGGDLGGGSETLAVIAPTLTAGNDPSRSPQSLEITQQVAAVLQAQSQVRRLTPVECERLMGWPDDHTRWTADGDEIADSHRYKMCGNGVASLVAAWLGKHLANASRMA